MVQINGDSCMERQIRAPRDIRPFAEAVRQRSSMATSSGGRNLHVAMATPMMECETR